jgi:transglutaminase-like putative cysteine protease
VQSDFLFNLQPWEFQGDYPRLWSEYNVSIPEFINYAFISQGYQSPVKERKETKQSFAVTDSKMAGPSERFNFSAGVVDYRWYLKNVPVLKEESFTSTLENHITRIEFQLSEYRDPLPPKNVMGTWTELTQQLMEADYFGAPLNKDNSWLSDVIGTIVKNENDMVVKARKIFAFVRDNFICTNYSDLYLNQTLRNIVKNKRGSVAELNLLLVAMLRYAGISADPVILSTRGNGYSYADYPVIDKFNYVIVQATIDGRVYHLDASEPRMGFGKLGYECYNGHARIINADAIPLELTADSLLEKKLTSVFIINDEKGNFSGVMQQAPGYYESYRLRSMIKEKGKDQLVNDIRKAFNADVEISNVSIDSVDKYDDQVNVKYNFNLKTDKDDIMYFNPMFGEGYKENPFKSAERFYPVEMPYIMDETYLLQLEIPQGYAVDELPKQIMLKLNDNDDGTFEYRITESNGTISLRSRLRIKRSYFQSDEYGMLREFFSLVVKKHSEQVVLKKKK